MTPTLALILWVTGWLGMPMILLGVQTKVRKAVCFTGIGLTVFTFTVILSYRF
jgi:hypothetical protein